MAIGISIHVGVNHFDPAYYGYDGRLRACENDARSMQSIALAHGYETSLLLSTKATAFNVLKELSKAAQNLRLGDILLFTYAGHGSQVPDTNNDEDDSLDETWCLYDRMLVDDELYRIWGQCKPGVRIVMVSDSCHSGSMARTYQTEHLAIKALLRNSESVTRRSILAEEIVYRTLPTDFASRVYNQNKDRYDEIQWTGASTERADIAASVISITACQDNQTAADGLKNGLFTANLLSVWNEGKFEGNYYAFYKEVISVMPSTQTPRFYTVGRIDPDFEREMPFLIPGAKVSSAGRIGKTEVKGEKTVQTNNKLTTVEDLDERLSQLKMTREVEAKPALETSKTGSMCNFHLEVPRDVLDGMSDVEAYEFLQGEGCDVLMKAYMAARDISTPRGIHGGIGCEFGGGFDKGGFSGGGKCTGGITIDF